METKPRQRKRALIYDLTGQRFGDVVAIKQIDEVSKNGSLWLCKSDSGEEVIMRSDRLRARKREYIIGQKFGELTVIEKVDSGQDHHARYKCECVCGNIKTVLRDKLFNREDKGCRCQRGRVKAGMKFGKATVLDRAGKDKHNNVLWKCICDDGSEIVVRAEQLYRFEKKAKQVSEKLNSDN